MRTNTKLLRAMSAMALCLAAAAHADTVQKRVPADPRGEVEIVNVSGDVQVSGWDRAEVEVNADLGRGVERLDVIGDEKNRRTTVKVVLPGGFGSSGSSDLIVRIPRESALTLNTVSADQTIADVRGAQRLQAVSGVISTQMWADELAVKTISGDVIVSAHKMPSMVAINTVSGSISLSDAAGELTIETVTGDMTATMDSLTRGRIRTTNGDLRLRAALARDARLDAEAVNGDLRFTLRNPVDAEFDIETFNGEIDNCFGPKSERKHEFAPGNALRFKEGSGSARLRVKTLNGGVEICKE